MNAICENNTMWRCLDLLFPPRVDEVALRNMSVDDFLALVVPRLVSETQPETIALLPFSDPRVRSAIHEAKYRGSGHAFSLLSSALVEYLRDADDEGFRKSYICLVPVPLGKERRKERGFNQIEEVAKRAVKELEIKIENDLLIRTRETISQISLARNEREKNMSGAFATARSADPSRVYVVVDDVTTTGATLQAAINALAETGAKHIIPLALAH